MLGQMTILLVALFFTSVLYYGFITILLIALVIFSFILGFCLLESPKPKVWSYEACDTPKGLPMLVANMQPKPIPAENFIITGSPQLDTVLNEILTNLMRDFIMSWYSTLTTDQRFPAAVRQTAVKILRKFSYRCAEADWITYLTKNLPDDFASHIRLYRTTLIHLQSSSNKKALNSIFFDLESSMEKKICREEICIDRQREKEYLGNLSNMLLYYFMEKEDYDNLPLRFLMKDLLVSRVFLHVIDLFSDPDYLDQCIISLTRDDSYTSDYFLQACRMSVNADELRAVLERINSFSAPLRGRDIGGDDDASVKAQLSSLEFLKSVCMERLKRLEKGLPLEKLDDEDVLQPNLNLYNMPFQQLMDTDLAVVAFLDFLDKVNVQYLLQMSLRIDSYRIAARQKLAFASESGQQLVEEVRKMAMEIFLDFQEKALKNHQFDSVYLGEYQYKVKHKPPTETIFDDLQKKLYEILERDEYFGEFRRSAAYVELLREMDLLREPMLSSDEELGDKDLGRKTLPSQAANLQTRITSADMTPEGVVLYTIQVSQVDHNGEQHSWTIQRRYKNFDELHKILLQSNIRLPSNLKLPAKKTFNHNSREVVEKRRMELETYLGVLLDPKCLHQSESLEGLVRVFLKEGPWENSSATNFATKSVSVIRDSFRSMLAMPDQMMDNLSRMLSLSGSSPSGAGPASSVYNTRGGGNTSTTSPFNFEAEGMAGRVSALSTPTSRSSQSSYNMKVGHGLEQEDSENIPMRILFLMLDEIFDLKRKNQLVRRSIFSIVRQLVKTFFGSHVNKMIVDKAQSLISASQLAQLLARLRDSWWPPSGGSNLLDNSSVNSIQLERDFNTRMRTRVVCRTRILGSVSEELSHFLGSETTRQGVQRLFNMCHNEVLNRRLVYVILEGCIRELLSNRVEAVNDFYHKELCPLHSGTVKSASVSSTLGESEHQRQCQHSSHDQLSTPVVHTYSRFA